MPLLNAFVDSLVSVGFSSERGAPIDPESKINGSLFTSFLQSSVLAIITADRAIYPQARGSEVIDPFYPPVERSRSHSVTTSSIQSGRSTPVSQMTSGLRHPKQPTIPPVFNHLPLFCFPDGVQATYQRENEKIHHIVFTQEDGKRNYAVVLTFQQAFSLKANKPDDEGIYQIDDVIMATLRTRRTSVSKIPIPIDKQKLGSPVASPSPSTPTTSSRSRSKKMPTSFHFSEPLSTTKKRSTSSSDLNKQPHYVTPTFSSYMKNLSAAAAPPPTRMVRTNSQTSLLSLNEPSSNNSTDSRTRSNSNASQQLKMSTAPSTSTPVDTTKPFYLPHCLVLISTQPYWIAMQETITIIHDEIIQSKIEPNSNIYKQLLKKYAFLACNTPTPPTPWERFSLSFSLKYTQSVLFFDPPIDTNHPVPDLDLSVVLLTLNIGKLLDVLAAIFTQQPIIFFSSNYSKLVTTLEGLLYLIYPLKWINVYVPLVPNGLRDHYLEGPPGAYIMGTHASHQAIVEELDISVACNLDNDKNIHIPKNIHFHNIPSTKLQRFIGPITQLVEEIKMTRSLQNVHTPIRLRVDQQREFERQQRIDMNQKITKIFLDLMVDLCGDALKPIYWTVSHQSSPTNTLTRTGSTGKKRSNQSDATITTFRKEKYLLSKTDGIELDFYRELVGSAAFQLLIEEEMVSSISPTIFKQICQVQSLSHHDQLEHFDNVPEELQNTQINQTKSESMLADSISSQMLLPLPDWPSNISTYYIDSCIEVFTNELENALQERSPAVIAVYAYLRGCALLARGNLIDGLRDLYLIENPNLFPRHYIETTIIPRLLDECLLDLFVHEPFYIDAPEWKKVQTHPMSQCMTRIDLDDSGNSFENSLKSSIEIDASNGFTVVEKALTYQQFSDHVQRLSIVLDKETTEALFHALLYWTDNNITKTLKKEKTLTSNASKSSDSLKPLNKSRLPKTDSLKDTLTMLNEHRRGNANATLLPKSSLPSNTSLPATLFESFLDNWQHTNAEKARMNRCLPEDRQKQESILKVSSSDVVSKKEGPGQLILTQKRLYFLPEARSSARLLTELMQITSIDKYQHQTVFSSSKPGIKIYTSNTSSLPRDNNLTLKSKSLSLEKELKSSINLVFNDNQEQELWYAVINELWSGLTIAHEECDISVLNKASRQIALMDTLASIDYDEETMSVGDRQLTRPQGKSKQRHNEASLEMALNDLSTFTRMRQTGAYKPLSAETRNVLTRRLSPSINETERHAIRCLVSIEHPDNGRSSLWCSYGSKLKVFNITTWICDPVNISFPSIITCMCLDARYRLWVGCIDGQLFVVDSLTRTCGPQLASIEGGCETIAFDTTRNYILTANQSSSVTLWNTSNWERLVDMNLFEIYRATNNDSQKTFKSEAVVTFRNKKGPSTTVKTQNQAPTFYVGSNDPADQVDMPNIPAPSGPAPVIPSSADKLQRIQIYENLLFACYQDDYILVLRISDSNTYTYEHLVSVKYKTGDSTPIESFLAYNKQIWVSTGCITYIFDINTSESEGSYNLLMKKPVDDDNLIAMLGLSGYIWTGSLRGNIYVFRMDNYELYKTFAGHRDSVFSLCPVLDMYVVSGSGQNDTSIGIWENVQTSNGAKTSRSTSVATTPTIK